MNIPNDRTVNEESKEEMQVERYAFALANDVVISMANEAQLAYRNDTEAFRNEAAGKYTGQRAWDGAAAVREYATKRAEEMTRDLEYQESRDQFARARILVDEQNRAFAARTATQETENYRRQTLEALNGQALEGVKNAPGAAEMAFRQIEQYNAQLYRNMPPEYVEGKSDAAFLNVVTQATQSLLEQDASAAQMFLQEDWVREREQRSDSLAGQIAKIRSGVDAANQNSMVSADAVAAVESGVESQDLRRLAEERYPDNPELANLFVSVGDAYSRQQQEAAQAEAVKVMSANWNDFAGNEFALDKLPAAFQNQHPETFRKMAEFSEWFNRADTKELLPDLHFQDKLLAMRPTEATAWLSDENNFDFMMRKMAGDSAEIGRVLDHAAGKQPDRADANARFDSAGFFQKAYGSLYRDAGGFDENNARSVARENGFRHHFARRSAEMEAANGRPLTDDDRKAVTFGILRDARNGVLNLDTKIYNERPA